MSNNTVPTQYNIGTPEEQNLIEDLNNQVIQRRGLDFYYIPRKLVYEDNVFGEDRLSRFKKAYPIRMYFENINSFGGDGFSVEKFGLMIDQTATLVCAKRMWERLIGITGDIDRDIPNTGLPNRPSEGDLIYFPLPDSLLEITYVEHFSPFMQLGRQYVYRLNVQTFTYSSERIDTGIDEIDDFEKYNSFNTDVEESESPYRQIACIRVDNPGSGYTEAPTVEIIGGGKISMSNEPEAIAHIDINGMVSGITLQRKESYSSTPTVNITGGNGMDATATAILELDIDKVNNLGRNEATQDEIDDLLVADFDNPFGDV